MKFFDSFKIALHNIKNNKSRSILTVIIVMIVSTLIMGLTTFGIMFNNNSLAINKSVFNEQGTTYYIQGKTHMSQDGFDSSYVEKEEIKEIESLIKKYNHIINKVSFDAYIHMSDLDSITLLDVGNYSADSEKLMISGRVWGPGDSNTNNIWISEEFAKSSALRGENYSVGDKIKTKYEQWNPDGTHSSKDFTFTIQGIFNYKAFSGYNRPNIIVDYHTIINNIDENIVNSITMSYLPPDIDYDYNALYADIESLDKEMKTLLGVNVYEYGSDERFRCEIIQTMEMNRLMGALIMGILILLSLLVLFLSIGSVANTMIISVDKNRKFIGLMKALGLNQKGVKKSISIESFLIIAFGILISSVLLFAVIQPFMIQALTKLFAQMYSFTKIKYEVVSDIPFYVPLITLLCFYFMAKLSSRSSLRKIASQDVISTISEVA